MIAYLDSSVPLRVILGQGEAFKESGLAGHRFSIGGS